MHSRSLAFLCLLAAVIATPAFATDFDVVIHEIHYNPLSGDDRDEFIEIVNRGPATVDLTGWSFTEGIAFTFPPGALIEPKQFLVVSPDAVHAASRYEIQNVVGNYTGKLDNDGEIVTLANRDGRIMSRIHYGDEGEWPSRPDGLGPSLEILDAHAPPDQARSWAASLFIDGTPGAPNSRADVGTAAPRALVGAQALWRYAKGTQEASNPAMAWTATTFNDAAWAQGPGAFGYGPGQAVETALTDMQNAYTSLYIRAKFDLTAGDVAGVHGGETSLTLTVRFDDGFVAYVNGVEVGRGNAANAGAPPAFNGTADSNGGGIATLNLDAFASSLVAGQNAVAVHGLNNTIGSSDFLLEADLSIAERPPSTSEDRSPVSVNEVRPGSPGDPGFLELHNSGGVATLIDHAIIDSAGHRFAIPNGTTVPAGGLRAFTEAQLGFTPAGSGATYVLVKRSAALGTDSFVDGLKTWAVPASAAGASFGRVPDGGDDLFAMTSPTQGAANTVSLSTSIVLNEIFFHPPFVAPAGGCTKDCSDQDQWIEVHNRGASGVDVAGWSITKGVDITIPPLSPLVIPANGYLVLASSRTAFLAKHPAFDASKVVGDWTRDLSHSSDTLNLRDPLGNRVDHVKYGDGSPRNDVEPMDGADDETTAGTQWPRGADGTGRTIELRHPGLDNRSGGAWALGPPGGTPGAQNAAFAAVPFAVVDDVEHSPAVPRPTDAVTVRCRVSATQTLALVEAVWHREGSAAGGTVALKDDGLSGDGAAGDGEYAGQIPAQPDRAVVGFQVRAQLADGKVTLVPAAPPVLPYPAFQGPYYLYQTVSTPPPLNPSEDYYVIMTQADLAELTSRPVESDELLPCTFIRVGKDGKATVRHLAGIRYRGESTRNAARKAYRIDFAAEQRFEDIQHLDLVASSIENEILAADLFRRAGMPYPAEWTVNLTFQGTLDPRYVRKEHLDGDFLTRFFGGASDSGNLYRALNPANGGPEQGNLSYLGEDPAPYAVVYDKRNHKEENDYSDVIELCRAFDPVQTPDAAFPDAIENLIDADEWARFFAIQSLLSNNDGSIQTNSGEDYLLYRVPFTSGRPDAGKWLLVPWDIEETFTDAAEPLFHSQVPAVRRFLTHPRFAPLYYANLVDLRSGVFSRFETRQRFGLINFLFGFGTIDGIDSYITARIGFIDSVVPVELSAGATSSVTGTRLVSIGDTWKYWKGTQEPAGAAFAWTKAGYAEAGWLAGATGIGYGDGDDTTVLDDMRNAYTTVYARRSFTLANPASVASLDLAIDYDDGFIAYLNGVEVARANVAGPVGTAVPFTGNAVASHEHGQVETFSLNAFLGTLVAGENVLSMQVFNDNASSSDLSLLPELVSGATTSSGGIGCGTVLYATGDTVALSGRANAHLTQSVTVNGAPAAYDAYQAVWSASVTVGAGDNAVAVRAFDGPNGTGNLIQTLDVTIRRLAGQPAQVSGALNGQTSWTKAGGPYLMTSTVTIPAGSKLMIGPGTLIIGGAGASIIVRGEIQAAGTEAEPILFRALSCSSRWGGIGLDHTGVEAASPTHTLAYCDLEFGDNPAGFVGCVSPVSSKLLVDHCAFRFLTANAIDGMSARVEVRDSLFEKINEGVHCNSSTVIVLDSHFTGMIGDKDAIDFDLNGPEPSRIERCLIENGSDDGIDLQETTVEIRDNVIRNIQDKALSLETDGPFGPPIVTGNLIYNSGSAIALKSGLNITECHHNTVVGNQEGLNLFAKAGAADGGHGIFHSLILWNNIVDVKLDALSSAEFSQCDISSGVKPGAGNISKDPGFVNVAAENYALRAGSPCIGTGQGGTDMGAIPFDTGVVKFLRADSDASGDVEITDVIYTLTYLFRAGTAPACLDAADANDNGSVDIADAVFTLFFLYAGGRVPPAPYPLAGPDPTGDGIQCQ